MFPLEFFFYFFLTIFLAFFKNGKKKSQNLAKKSLNTPIKSSKITNLRGNIGDNIVIKCHAKKLRNRSVFECVAAVDARAQSRFE